VNKLILKEVNFSIIIPTRKRISELSTCLDKLVIQLNANDEIIVSEDDETLESQIFLKKKYPNVKWLAGPCKGPAANRNNGAKIAINDYLIFLDDDCIPNANIISNYRSYVQKNPDIDAVEGCIKPEGKNNSLAAECPINEVGGCFWSCNVLFKKKSFESLTGFDEDFPFPGMEDPEIYYRMRSLGMLVPFLAEAFVMHPWVIRKDKRSVFHHRLSLLIYLNKHFEETKRIGPLYFIRHAKNQLKALISGAIRGSKDKVFMLSKIIQSLRFSMILRNSGSIKKYVEESKPCCSGCSRAVDYLLLPRNK